MRKNKEYSVDDLCRVIVNGMLEKKATDIAVMDLRGVKNAITDYFIICSGNSDTQIDAIAFSVEDEVEKNLQQSVWHREGKQNREWILLDFVDVVVHIFRKDRRSFYDLESLWGDANTTYYGEKSQ